MCIRDSLGIPVRTFNLQNPVVYETDLHKNRGREGKMRGSEIKKNRKPPCESIEENFNQNLHIEFNFENFKQKFNVGY